MLKSQEDYSAKGVVQFLVSQRKIIHGSRKPVSRGDNKYIREHREQQLTQRIIKAFDQIGIPPNAVGRKYLIDGITLIIRGHTERIHYAIAFKYSKSESSIERAMQNAIAKAWSTADIGDLLKYYTARIHSTKGVPTVMEFIYHYAEKLNTGDQGDL